MKTPPLRLVLYTGSDSRRDLADLSITATLNKGASVTPEEVHESIRTVTAERRYSDLENLALACAHRLLDTQTSIAVADIEIIASSWRRLGTQAFERASSECRVARAAVNRNGTASVSAAIRGLQLLMGPPVIETITLDWRYKSAGTSYNSAWSAVRKLVLQAFDDREEPQGIAQLLADVIETLAEVRLTIGSEPLMETIGPGMLTAAGSPTTISVTAAGR